jgi:hypothetical protein
MRDSSKPRLQPRISFGIVLDSSKKATSTVRGVETRHSCLPLLKELVCRFLTNELGEMIFPRALSTRPKNVAIISLKISHFTETQHTKAHHLLWPVITVETPSSLCHYSPHEPNVVEFDFDFVDFVDFVVNIIRFFFFLVEIVLVDVTKTMVGVPTQSGGGRVF